MVRGKSMPILRHDSTGSSTELSASEGIQKAEKLEGGKVGRLEGGKVVRCEEVP